MYSWYKRTVINKSLSLSWEEKMSLAGCNKGIIANELKEILKPTDNPSIGWILPIAQKWNKQNYSVIIDIKPNNKQVFLCELDTVFGYTFSEWSPIMLRLKILYNDKTKDEIDKNNFVYPVKPEIIYTMLYLYGSIRNGQLFGTWNFPGRSSTNALLFWPEAMTFFYEQVKIFDPYFLNSEINLISSLMH
jgi:hypothetical protein